MTATATAPTTFHLFPRLPAELRIKIWHLTIFPAGPTLCPFCPPLDFWTAWSRALSENQRTYGYSLPLHGVQVVDFGTGQLPITSTLPPSALACHEARAAVLERAKGLLVTTPTGRRVICTRTFDADQDVLFFRRVDISRVEALLKQLHPDTDVAALIGARRMAVHEHWLDIDSDVVMRLLKQIGTVEVVADVPVQLEECRRVRAREGVVWRLKREGWGKVSAGPRGVDGGWREARLNGLVQKLGNVNFLHPGAEIKELVAVPE
ncbi:hypothetical protein K461DRAFT_65588 [Myriangium duriaei CBS 260.36]|uniref:2EXR domain-containing protein n=1 Tax=Myriangium duriaei CBS 260.36 TaxID=1168546 RepID=A0A9P4MD49_9PEZI|nr:hypothetical protein K461DRAFT_65588 [Myriangium duriaei CBS 260.36]